MDQHESPGRARAQRGGPQPFKEIGLEAHGTGLFGEALRNLDYAKRIYANHKHLSAVAVVALASALGITVALVGMVNGLLFTWPPGVQDAARVLRIGLVARGEEPSFHAAFSYPQFTEFVNAQAAFTGVAGYARFEAPARTPTDGEMITQEVVTGDYFSVLGVAPFIGRVLQIADDIPGGPSVVMISYRYWQRAFHGDPNVAGKTLLLRNNTVTIVGVAPRGFSGTSIDFLPDPDIWIPAKVWATINRSSRLTLRFPMLSAIGRLKADVPREAAATRVSGAMQHITVLPADSFQFDGVAVEALHRTSTRVRENFARLFSLLLGVSGVAVLAACFNVANLLLAWGSSRGNELAVRSAMGATSATLVRQLLTEGALLGAFGGLLAILVAFSFGHIFGDLGRILSIQDVSIVPVFDLRLLGAGLALTFLATLSFGLLPALVLAGRTRTRALASTSMRVHGGPWKPWFRRAVLAGQCAFAAILACVTMLYGHTLDRLRDIPLGFDAEKIVVMRVDPYALSPEEGARFYSAALRQVAEVPGVGAVGSSLWHPLSGVVDTTRVIIPGRADLEQTKALRVGYGFFKAYGIPVSGRAFESDDDLRAGVLVNHLFALKYWPGESALGQVVRTQGLTENTSTERIVLGVTRLDRCSDIADAPAPCVFLPLRYLNNALRLSMRIEGPLVGTTDRVRAAISRIDRRVLVSEVRPFTASLHERMGREWTTVALTMTLAVVGLVLVVVGCTGVFSAMIEEQRPEIALRLALGARPSRLVREVVRRGLLWSLVGVALGLGSLWVLTNALGERVFAVSPPGAGTLLTSALAILLTALLVTWMAALRIVGIHPNETLRR